METAWRHPGKEEMRGLFTRIAGRYDALNRALTFGIDVVWRRRALAMLARAAEPRRILDLATGTADLAIGAARRFASARVVGVDLTPAMLARGREKARRAGVEGRVDLVEGNASVLAFPSGAFDAVTCAFGFRNFPDVERALEEAGRVLRPGGVLLVLELFRMESRLFARATSGWLRLVAPLLARARREDYAYLRRSIERTLTADDFAARAARAGFAREEGAFFPPSCHCLLLRKCGRMCP